MTRWLITGGCGFIGTSLIARLSLEHPGDEITVLDNLSVGTSADLAEVCSFIEVDAPGAVDSRSVALVVGDIRDVTLCREVTKGVDNIVHLAANTGVWPSVQEPRLDMEANVIGTFNVLEAARENGVRRFVFASSGAAVGTVEPPIHEDVAPRPVSPYGSSKLAGEAYCSSYFHTFGLNTVSLRFGNVYGPRSRRKQSVVAKFIRQALSGEVSEIYGDGTQTRDFIYIDDLTAAVLRATSFDGGGEVFEIASGNELTVNELAEVLKEVFEQETGRVMEIVHGDRRVGDVERNYADISKARKLLGWSPDFDIRQGLRNTIRSLSDRKSAGTPGPDGIGE